MPRWLVLADDRSGALEVAGELADRIGPVSVVAHSCAALPDAAGVVVDLGSRHLTPEAAKERAATWASPAQRQLHKIDSTLRGRWADELVAVQARSGSRVLVVAALPRLGRTCVGGVVHVDGAPLELDDVRHGRAPARPADVLASAGAGDVVELTITGLDVWLTDGAERVAVCDAATDADLEAIGQGWRASTGVVFAGTSASIAAAVESGGRRSPVTLGRPVVVAIGSLHPTARAQLAALRTAALVDVDVLSTDPAAGTIDATAADAAAADLADAVQRRLARGDVATLVVVGGDSAAAVLGDGVHVAGGTVAPGIPWARRADGTGPLIVTKAGGFGNPNTLVDLLAGRRSSEARDDDEPGTDGDHDGRRVRGRP